MGNLSLVPPAHGLARGDIDRLRVEEVVSDDHPDRAGRAARWWRRRRWRWRRRRRRRRWPFGLDAEAPATRDLPSVLDRVVDDVQRPCAVGIRAVERQEAQPRRSRSAPAAGRIGTEERLPVAGSIAPSHQRTTVRERRLSRVVEQEVGVDNVDRGASIRHHDRVLSLRPDEEHVEIVRPGVVESVQLHVQVRGSTLRYPRP